MGSRFCLATSLAIAPPLLALGLPAGPAAAVQALTLVERASTDTVTDIGAEGDSAGDILTFTNEVYDQANATKVGQDNGWCVRTAAGKAWECFGPRP